MTIRPALALAPALALLGSIAAPLAACDRGEEQSRDEQTVVARTAEAELPHWLQPTDGTDPARWLAGREAGRALPASAEPVQTMRKALDEARPGFIEDPRMIANRTVQLGEMLSEIGKPEGYRSLIAGFGEVAARRGRHKSLYGEMCQHYYNTRARGLGHADALKELAEHEVRPAEGPRGP